MHECPDCGQACDCDGEDLWNDEAARECDHGCTGRDACIHFCECATDEDERDYTDDDLSWIIQRDAALDPEGQHG